MSAIWDAETFDAARRRLVPCFDEFYGAVVELVTGSALDRITELGELKTAGFGSQNSIPEIL